MSHDYTNKIVSWRYEVPYDIYGYSDSDRESNVAYLTDERNRFFAVISEGSLIGFRSFGEDGRVLGGTYDDSYLDTGGGLRPDLTGKGIGEEVVRKGLEFGSDLFGNKRFRVTIAAFNERALKVCKRLGFHEDQKFQRESDGAEFVLLTLEKLKREPFDCLNSDSLSEPS